MNFTFDVDIPALSVFVQGLLSFFSPCVLPLIPLYMGYLSGGAAVRDEQGQMHYPRGKVALNTLFFTLGISFAFMGLALGMTALGKFFNANQMIFARIGGVILILFGLYQLGVFGQIGFVEKERRLPWRTDRLTMSPFTALIMGFIFSFAWTPCIGPVLSGVLLMAATSASRARGLLLVGVYTIGFILPFLAVGLFTTSLLELFRKHRKVVQYTVRIGAVIMILMGILMVTGLMNRMSGWLTQATTAEESSAEESSAVSSMAESVPEVSAEESSAVESIVESQPESQEESSGEESGSDLEPAPDFTLKDQYGAEHSLADYRGKIVFLNFWATWCPPCRAEMPDIQKLYEKYNTEDSEVVILGLASPGMGSEGSDKYVANFLAENGYTYPVAMDMDGMW